MMINEYLILQNYVQRLWPLRSSLMGKPNLNLSVQPFTMKAQAPISCPPSTFCATVPVSLWAQTRRTCQTSNSPAYYNNATLAMGKDVPDPLTVSNLVSRHLEQHNIPPDGIGTDLLKLTELALPVFGAKGAMSTKQHALHRTIRSRLSVFWISGPRCTDSVTCSVVRFATVVLR